VQLSEWCGQRGLQVRPLSRYYLTAPVQQGLVLGYAYVPANRVPEWATRLADTLAEQLAENTAQARQ
jgi:GntR family transcriptional regulator/MocR family aminotransferase